MSTARTQKREKSAPRAAKQRARKRETRMKKGGQVVEDELGCSGGQVAAWRDHDAAARGAAGSAHLFVTSSWRRGRVGREWAACSARSARLLRVIQPPLAMSMTARRKVTEMGIKRVGKLDAKAAS